NASVNCSSVYLSPGGFRPSIAFRRTSGFFDFSCKLFHQAISAASKRLSSEPNRTECLAHGQQPCRLETAGLGPQTQSLLPAGNGVQMRFSMPAYHVPSSLNIRKPNTEIQIGRIPAEATGDVVLRLSEFGFRISF